MTGLRLERVTVRFGGVEALADVSLAVEPGCVTGLVGPNGAGKTTALQVFSGFIRPGAGAVRLDGQDVSRWTPARRGRSGVGRTFQRAELFPSLDTLDNVALAVEARRWRSGRSARTDARETALEMLERCGALDLAPRAVGELGAGQRRLVELARSLAGRARYLLLDEPAAGTSLPEREKLAVLLRDLAADEGLGILLVEHDLGLVGSVCARVVVLQEGRVVYGGAAEGWTRDRSVRSAYLGERHAGR